MMVIDLQLFSSHFFDVGMVLLWDFSCFFSSVSGIIYFVYCSLSLSLLSQIHILCLFSTALCMKFFFFFLLLSAVFPINESIISRSTLHDLPQSSLGIRAQLLIDELRNSPARSAIRFTQVRTNPSLDVLNLWERVSRQRLAGVERGETHAEANILDVSVLDECVVGGRRERRVDEEFEEGLAGDCPTALVEALDKGL